MLTSAISSVVLFLSGLLAAVPQPVDWRVMPHDGGGGRVLFARDPVLLELANAPDSLPEFKAAVRADDKGQVAHDMLKSGWAGTVVTVPEATTAIVTGRGFHSFFVNGERFAGDIYNTGILRLPIPLRKGENRILVRAVRGEFTFRLAEATGDASLSEKDALLPDLRPGVMLRSPGAVIVLNHTGELMTDAVLEVGDGRVFARELVPVGPVLPYGTTKAAFRLRQLRHPGSDDTDPKGLYRLPVVLRRGATNYTALLPMTSGLEGSAYVETRVSKIDGSVQFHAVHAPVKVEAGKRYALYLSLHGAGVVGINQARAYRAKRDGFVIAPTNRRKYGFDWQEWGRLDALEALEFALGNYPIDPTRVYLTGHSMGGHGTWYLGALHPSRFAAIAPSAGWMSFFTYGGGIPRVFGRDPDLRPFAWAANENDTAEFVRNLERTPVYILHGEKDDNVPVGEAERFIEMLEGFHRDFEVHIQPGAGHWWGDECVDWPPLFEFLRRHVRVEKPLRFSFTTPNPGISANYAWATIHCQERPGRMSRIVVDVNTRKRRVEILADNILEVRLDLEGVLTSDKATIVVDGAELPVQLGVARALPSATPPHIEGYRVRLVKALAGDWRLVPHHVASSSDLPDTTRNADRCGPFKLAFKDNMVWVYGTQGDEEEDAATLAKVRYDSQVWWYRGNGSVTILPDTLFDSFRQRGRNVILYGNADTNSAFAKLLPDDAPVTIRRSSATAGGREYEGDFGLFLVYVRSDEEKGLVGVVGATSARAMRMAQQARYFVSGSAIPDWVIWDEAALEIGMEGVAASGYFDSGWGFRDPRED